jgi:hypothetical protein
VHAPEVREDSLILETDWITPDGALRVTDFMSPTSPESQVVRLVECLAGCVRVHTTVAARMDYGHVVPRLRRVAGHAVSSAGRDAVWLSTAIP